MMAMGEDAASEDDLPDFGAHWLSKDYGNRDRE